jgi:hypothetical protein
VFRPGLLERIADGTPLRLTPTRQPRVTVSNLLSETYHGVLNNPTEYVFKNEIVNQLFLRHHSADRTAVLTEFRVGNTRLDLLVANGTTTCYEIKTDRDELRRLRSQLTAALRVFDKVYVVTTPRHRDSVVSILDQMPRVGLYVLDPSTRLTRVRAATPNAAYVDVATIFDCLRQYEYAQAIQRKFGFVPSVPNTRFYSACKTLFASFAPTEAQKVLACSLRRRGVRKGDAVDHLTVPYEVRLLYFNLAPRHRGRFAHPAIYNQPAWG